MLRRTWQGSNNDTTWYRNKRNLCRNAYRKLCATSHFLCRDAKNAGTVERSVWLPKGGWHAWSKPSAKPLAGPVVDTQRYGLDETPIYVRSGAVRPTQSTTRRPDLVD